MEKLEKIYEYFLHGIDRSKIYNEKGKISEYEYKKYVTEMVFEYILGLYDYKGRPKILKDEDFNSISQTKLFHGFRKFEHGANYLLDEKYHVGSGFTGGFFLTTLKEEANVYTENVNTNERDENKILATKMLTDNFVKYHDLTFFRYLMLNGNKRLDSVDNSDKLVAKLERIRILHEIIPDDMEKEKFIEFYNNLQDFNGDDYYYAFLRLFTDNLASLAVALGYDGILYEKTNTGFVPSQQGDFVILLNRAKLAAQESEVDRFLINSKKAQAQVEGHQK